MKAAKIGRPKLPKRECKGKLLGVRFMDAERREIDAAAKAAEMALSEWARCVPIAASRLPRLQAEGSDVRQWEVSDGRVS